MQMRSSYEEHIVEYRYLGKSGLYASRICVGGVQLGSEGVSQSQVDKHHRCYVRCRYCFDFRYEAVESVDPVGIVRQVVGDLVYIEGVL
jgi:hypothetical protein